MEVFQNKKLILGLLICLGVSFCFFLVLTHAGSIFIPIENFNLDYKLIENTDQCLGYCRMVLGLRVDKDITIPNDPEKFKIIFKKAHIDTGNIEKFGMRLLKNETYYHRKENKVCYPFDYFDGNTTQTNQNCSIEVELTEKWKYVWKKFNPLGKSLKANKWYIIELWAVRKPKLQKNSIDAIPVIMGKELPFAWWNSSWDAVREVKVNTSVSYADVWIPIEISINTSGSNAITNCNETRYVSADNSTELPRVVLENDPPNCHLLLEFNKTDGEYDNVTVGWIYYNSTTKADSSITMPITNTTDGTDVIVNFTDRFGDDHSIYVHYEPEFETSEYKYMSFVDEWLVNDVNQYGAWDHASYGYGIRGIYIKDDNHVAGNFSVIEDNGIRRIYGWDVANLEFNITITRWGMTFIQNSNGASRNGIFFANDVDNYTVKNSSGVIYLGSSAYKHLSKSQDESNLWMADVDTTANQFRFMSRQYKSPATKYVDSKAYDGVDGDDIQDYHLVTSINWEWLTMNYRLGSLADIGWDTTSTATLISENMTAVWNGTFIALQGEEETEESAGSSVLINLTLNGSDSDITITYGESANITASSNITGLPVELYQNGTLIHNDTDRVENITDVSWFNNATFNITAAWVGNATYPAASAIHYIRVSKAPATATQTVTPASPITYETQSTASCVDTDSQGTGVLERNGTDVTATENDTAILLGYGGYNYTCSVSSENYTAASDTEFYSIAKKDANILNFPETQSLTYPSSSVTQYCIDSATLLDCNIYRNETLLTNGSTERIGAGVWNYTANITDTANYTNWSNSTTLTVNKGTPNRETFIDDQDGNKTVTYSTSVVIKGNSTTTITPPIFNLYINDITESGNPATKTVILSGGIHNIVYNTSGNANYSSASNSTLYLIVDKGATLTKLFQNKTEANVNYWNNTVANFTVTSNVTGQTVSLDTNISAGWTKSGTTPLFNYTTLTAAWNGTVINVTGYVSGDENYTSSSVTRYAIIRLGYNYSETFNTSGTENSIHEFSLDFFIDPDTDFDNITAAFYWNSTNQSYNTSIGSVPSGYQNFSISIAMPEVSANTNVSFYWLYTIWHNDSSSDLRNLTTRTFTIQYGAVSTNCSSGALALNFTLWDEENITHALRADISLFIELTEAGGVKEFWFNHTNVTNVSICIFPADVSYFMDAHVQYESNYSGKNFAIRNYFFENATLDNATDHIRLYLLEIDAANAYILFTINDPAGNSYENATLKIQRWYVSEGAYYTVAMGRSDVDGNTMVYLRLYDTWYRFIVERGGIAKRSFDKSIITSSTIILSLAPAAYGEYWEYYDKLAYTCSFSNATNYLTCTYTDTSGLSPEICLDVNRLTVVNSSIDLCDDCITSTSGTLACFLGSNVTGRTYSYQLYAKYPDSEWVFEQAFLEFTPSTLYGLTGTLAAFIIFLVLVGAGGWKPEVSIVLSVLTIIAAAIMGLIAIGIGGIMGLIVAAGILLVKMRG